MKKFAIVCCKSKNVIYVYTAEKANQKSYGGPWGRSEKFIHVEMTDDAKNLSPSQLKPGIIDIQVGTKRQSIGFVEVKGMSGDTILDTDGKPVLVEDFEEVPIIESVQRVIPKT